MSKVVCVLKTDQGGLWAVPQMLAARERGHDICFVIPPGGGRLRRELDVRGVPVVESVFDFSFRPSWRLLRGLLALRRQLASLDADVFFYHLLASALAVRIATFGWRVRRVHMVAGPLYLDSRPIRSAERVLSRLDTVVIGGSDHTADRYRQLGMPASRVRAIPYGVDLERFDPRSVEPEPSVDSDVFTAIMVAYVYAPKKSVYPGVGIKGHEVILEAWDSFAKDHPDSELVLVGAGFDEAGELHREELKKRWASTWGVRWIDSVEDVRPWYAAAQVSVSPSLSENHGAALEASAMECPSIVSDAGALPETVVAGDTGWVVPRGQVEPLQVALERAYAWWRTGELRAMGTRARALMAEGFDQRSCAARVADELLDAQAVV
jgi:glycosyltransferase involved in cell wall biosynthesis